MLPVQFVTLYKTSKPKPKTYKKGPREVNMKDIGNIYMHQT